MKNKLHIFLFCLLSGAIYSQTTANPNIIKKDIPIRQGSNLIDYPNIANRFDRKVPPKTTGDPVYYYNNKFYSKDILKKISPDSIYRFEMIKIPDSISKDLRSIIYVRATGK